MIPRVSVPFLSSQLLPGFFWDSQASLSLWDGAVGRGQLAPESSANLLIQTELPEGAETPPNPDVEPDVPSGDGWEGSRCWIYLRQRFLEQNSIPCVPRGRQSFGKILPWSLGLGRNRNSISLWCPINAVSTLFNEVIFLSSEGYLLILGTSQGADVVW